MKQLTVGSLFSGIGGIDLGLGRAGMRVVWQSEIDPYASRVLAKHWPGVPNHGDITQIDFATVEPVDVLAGGFPCQDLSNANQFGKGLDGEKSGLWREYVRAIGALRPRYVFVENVANLLARGFGRVLGDLVALGYDAEWDCIPASAVGAPHLRDRLFLVAYANGQRRKQLLAESRVFPQKGDHLARLPGLRRGARPRWMHADGILRPAEPALVRVADGIPSRVGELTGLGNAVVPQIPELIGGWIIEHWNATQTEAAA